MNTSRLARRASTALLALVLLSGAAACGGDDEPAAGGGDQQAEGQPAGDQQAAGETDGASVEIKLFRYQPDTITVAPGEQVTWRNEDQILHTVTAGTPDEPSDEFDEELGKKGDTATITFDKAGTFQYFCSRHPEAMRGTVEVQG